MATIDTSGTVLLQQNGAVVQYSLDNSVNWIDISSNSWPVTLANADTSSPLEVIFVSGLSFNSADQYFIIDSSNITIDGSDNVVYVSTNNYPGLVKNGAGSNANSYITIQNVGVESTNTLADRGGWIGQRYFGNGATDNYVTNCYSTGNIGHYAGGIFGQLSSGSISNCDSSGTIGQYSGGIFGNSSSGSATNCYSIGDIGFGAGGIFGSESLASASATNCYSTGTIGPFTDGNAGGIFGIASQGSATNCYSIGDINGSYSSLVASGGGIFAPNGRGSATNCYSTGSIDEYSGGIFGHSSSGSAINCYSIGTIRFQAGGIFGIASQGSATNCYSTGTIGEQAGGIFGLASQGSASNCYSTGPIDSQAGGIFGQNSTGSATNCYSTGLISDGGEGIGVADASYCYATEGSANWSDASANDALDLSGNPWTDIDLNSTNVPYRLTSFLNQQILYDPSSGTNVTTENSDLSGNYTWSITSVNGSTTNNEGITINSSTGEIEFNVSSNGTYAVNVLAEDSFGNYSYETFTNIISNICFPAGTPIVTNQGIIAINKINPAIHTIRNKKIVAITKTVTPDKYLVRFAKDALGPNLPCEATTMTKNHMLFYKGKMMKADEFLKTHNELVSKVPYNGQVLYNVLLEEHDKMVVNNLICETLHPDNYVAKMYRAFKSLTPKQRVELIKQVNKAVLTENIYNKPTAKKFTFTVSK